MAANPNPFRITTELWWAWEESKKIIPGVRYGGTYTPKRYYHSSVEENLARWAPNYSIRMNLDLKGGNKTKGRAIDLTMSDEQMRKRTRLLRDSALDPNDGRLFGMREFYGTIDGRNVYGLIKDDEDGPWRSASSDSSHLWHIHAAWFAAMIANAKALAGFISVISGESLSAWRKRTGSTAPPKPTTPTTPSKPTDWTKEAIMALPTIRDNSAPASAKKKAQSLLAAAGYPPANTFDSRGRPDGNWGPGSKAATKSFQKAKGLGVDGVPGPKTWTKLIAG